MISAFILWFVTFILVEWLQHKLLGPHLVRPVHRLPDLGLDLAVISLPYLLLLLISAQPWLSSILTLALFITLYIIHQAKFRALQEPLVFSDIYLYLQVLTHPRLFLPFLNLPLTAFALLTGIITLGAAAYLEPRIERPVLTLMASLPLLCVYIVLATQNKKLSFQPQQDIQRYGFFNSLVIYSLQALNKTRLKALKQRIDQLSPFQAALNKDNVPSNSLSPDILVIQSESFCDIRNLSPLIRQDLLQNFDHLRQRALAQGTLSVPAWGANTLRPEFAFLSGIDNQQLEHYRFNPYQFIQNHPVPTLASWLKAQGYHTVCIHPNHSAFFKRNRVFPLMGFDEFIDIRQFDPKDTEGPYISDRAVAAKIRDCLATRPEAKPLFIFAITMENHGPLHLEKCEDSALKEFYHQGQTPLAHEDLTIYLRHLRNADRMLKSLVEAVEKQERSTYLCWYGDHVPSMPDVYAASGFDQGHTQYLIWHNQKETQQAEPCPETALSVHQLSLKLQSLVNQG